MGLVGDDNFCIRVSPDGALWKDALRIDRATGMVNFPAGTTSAGGGAGSVRNLVINGNFSINQRAYVSATALAAGAFGHDRWKAGAGGCTYTFAATPPNSGFVSATTSSEPTRAAITARPPARSSATSLPFRCGSASFRA